MSFRRLRAALDVRGLSCAEALILIRLADHENEKTGQCNPSFARLATECGFSRRYVITNVNSLERKGLIRINERPYKTNLYTFIGEMAIQEKDGGGNCGSYGVVNYGSLPVVNNRSLPVVNPCSPEPINKNQEKEARRVTTTTCCGSTPLPPKVCGGYATHSFSSDSSSNTVSTYTRHSHHDEDNPPPQANIHSAITEPSQSTPSNTPEKRHVDAPEPSGRKLTAPTPQERPTGRKTAFNAIPQKEPPSPKPPQPLYDVLEALDRTIGKTYDRAAVSAAYQARHAAGWKDANGNAILDPASYCLAIAKKNPIRNPRAEPPPPVSVVMNWVFEDNPDGFTFERSVISAIHAAHRTLCRTAAYRKRITAGYRAYFNGVARRADNQTIQRVMSGDCDYANAVPAVEEDEF